MRIPIGELLMQQGVLTAEQCQAVLDRQAASHRPFGEIAEELFHVDGKAVERAWASQYAKITRWVDPLTETVDPMVQDLVTRHAWGNTWQRPGIDLRTRSIVTVSMLVALGRMHELKTHVRGALNNGVTPAELQEIFLHASVYCGFPAAVDAFRSASEVIDAA